MPRSITLGNGNILVNLDRYAEVRDFYFPFVGLENHVRGHHSHKIGVWVGGSFSWLDDGTWEININIEKETLASAITAVNKDLRLSLEFRDIVYNEKNVFLREVHLTNLGSEVREVKIFFHQAFEIAESHRGDTAFFEPRRNVIIHYKGRRVFLINARDEFHSSFSDYSVGIFEIESKEGTYKDAEDGFLSRNPVEHGKVDSVVGFDFNLESQKPKKIYYWIVASKSINEAHLLNNYVIEKTEEHISKTTRDFWHAWVNKQNFDFKDLDKDIMSLFKKSLLVIRTHTDNHGGIIASSDSDMLQHGRDTYSYVWPRDAVFAAIAMDKTGDANVAKRFFEFCNETISAEGYFFHKYQSDKSIGSSWHPWVRNGLPELPIQEDETALVLNFLWEHYKNSKDLEFIESVYNSLIKKSAEFIAGHINENTGLLLPTYDLWEEKYGITTFTASAVYGALTAAAKFSDVLGKTGMEKKYLEIAEKIRKAILKYLWDEEVGVFIKMINFDAQTGDIIKDKTLDMSSLYGIFKFGVLEADDEKVKKMAKIYEEKLSVKTAVGGIGRYENDKYYQVEGSGVSNPWIITTLWLAEYYIAIAKNEKDLNKAKNYLAWVAKYALPSGVLGEQLNPYTGAQISASPLTWSHAEFVLTVIQYLEKYNKIKE